MLLFFVLIAACVPDLGDSPAIKVQTNGKVAVACTDLSYPLEEGVVPYRAGGTFEVSVALPVAQFTGGTRATVEIVTSELVPGSALASTTTLVEDGKNLAGTVALVWPRGGSFTYAVEVAGTRKTFFECLELPDLEFRAAKLRNNGSLTTIESCLDSSTSDGQVAVRVEGGTLKDGATEASLPLGPGSCDGADAPADNPRSHSNFTVIAKQAEVDVVAVIPNSGFPRNFRIDVPPVAPLTLTLNGPNTAAPLSIVELQVIATRGAALATGIALAFEAVPSVVFLPATATTGEDGSATVRFQKPAEGPVYVLVRAGAAIDDIIVD